jgi:hypothetical protein
MSDFTSNSYLGDGLQLGKWSVTGQPGKFIDAPIRYSGGGAGQEFSTLFFHITGDGNNLRGFGASQMRILVQQMEMSGLTYGTRTIRFADGSTVQCKKNFYKEDVYIDVPSDQQKIIIVPCAPLRFFETNNFGIMRTITIDWNKSDAPFAKVTRSTMSSWLKKTAWMGIPVDAPVTYSTPSAKEEVVLLYKGLV